MLLLLLYLIILPVSSSSSRFEISSHSSALLAPKSSSSSFLCIRGGGGGGGGLGSGNGNGDDNNQDVARYDFDQMSKLLQRLTVLENVATDILLSFYDDETLTFATSGGGSNNVGGSVEVSNHAGKEVEGDTRRRKTINKKICVTSTCYALLSLKLLLEDTVDLSSSLPSSSKQDRVSLDKTLGALLTAPFREDDLFQMPLLLYTILFVDSDRSIIRNLVSESGNDDMNTIANVVSQRLQKLLRTILDARPHRHYGIQQANSDYVIYQICKSIAILQRQAGGPGDSSRGRGVGIGGLPKCVIPKPSAVAYGDEDHDISLEVYFALLRCAEVSSNELCRQLAYRISGDITSFDVIRLAYSLLTYVRSTDSLSGIASIREIDNTAIAHDDGSDPQSLSLSSETKVVPLNKKLVKKALATFFDEQNRRASSCISVTRNTRQDKR